MRAARRTLLIGFLLVASVPSACSDEVDPGPPGGGGADLGAGDQGVDPSDAPSQDAPPEDASPEDALDLPEDGAEDAPAEEIDFGEPRGEGELCGDDRQCASGLCFLLEAGADQGFCTDFCFSEQDCALEGFDCVRLVNGGSDGVQICAPVDFCLDLDDDGYGIGPGCEGPDCDDEDPDSNPGAAEVCDGVDNDCDGEVDDRPEDVERSCQTGLVGACAAGNTACVEGALVCAPLIPPTNEVCDALDNDCDGEVDNGDPGGGEACATGVPGECAEGTTACLNGTVECVSDQQARAEICNNRDDDCDGEIDEQNPEAGRACDTGGDGVCSGGVTDCRAGRLLCIQVEAPGEEVCDALDNDCDGQVDEDDPQGGIVCATGLGGTCAAGLTHCNGGNVECVPDHPPVAEICNGLDDDCDDLIDQGNPEGDQRCDTGRRGVCADGRTVCRNGGVQCDPIGMPGEEICDGLDNDCDGTTDEGEDGEALTRRCYDGAEGTDGVGACVAGAQRCEGGDFGACDGQVLPAPESCDGADNDCDGAEDEDNPEAGVRCQTGALGVCALGVSFCEAGALGCQALAQPSAEVCDGLDNDCDGGVDEDGGGQPLARSCYDGDEGTAGVGACVAGAQRCEGGQFGACDGQVLPAPGVLRRRGQRLRRRRGRGQPRGRCPLPDRRAGRVRAGRDRLRGGRAGLPGARAAVGGGLRRPGQRLRRPDRRGQRRSTPRAALL
jgi:hypothetical protein